MNCSNFDRLSWYVNLWLRGMICLLHVQIYEIFGIVYKRHVCDIWTICELAKVKYMEYDMILSDMTSFTVCSVYDLAHIYAKYRHDMITDTDVVYMYSFIKDWTGICHLHYWLKRRTWPTCLSSLIVHDMKLRRRL